MLGMSSSLFSRLTGPVEHDMEDVQLLATIDDSAEDFAIERASEDPHDQSLRGDGYQFN